MRRLLKMLVTSGPGWILLGLVALSVVSCSTTPTAVKPSEEQVPAVSEQPATEPAAKAGPEAPPPLTLPPSLLKDREAEKEKERKAATEEAMRRRRPGARIDEDDNKNIILNFENADINTVIETVGDILGINYILSPGISGQVTIQSNSKFPVDDLFSIFQTVLELNNLTAVKEGAFYHILPLDQAKGLPLGVEKGKEVLKTLDAGFVTQIITVEYIKAADAANVLRSLLPRGADLVVYEPTNLLLVTARPNGLRRLMKILEAVDIAPTEGEGVRTFVYYAEHGEAKSLVDILKTIFSEEKGKAPTPAAPKRTTTPARTTPATTTQRTTPRTPTPAPEPSAPTTVTGELGMGSVVLTAYEDINAILIKSTPKEYLTIIEALKKLDVPRRQVLIDVMVAEVTLTDEEQYGIEWLLKTKTGFGNGSQTLTTGILASADSSGSPILGIGDPSKGPDILRSLGGFAHIVDPGNFNALIRLFASRGQLKVIASPSLLATDTKEARIEVGQEVPTATGNVTTGEAGNINNGITTVGQIQYRTTGVILEVTPFINAKNNVTLKLSQEISNVAETTTRGIDSPTFNQRKAKTTAIVEDGHTLVIGGLISERGNRTRVGIPFLSDIPVLGYLFGSTSDTTTRTELLILVTPHIVTQSSEADAITAEYQDRVKTIKKKLDLFNR